MHNVRLIARLDIKGPNLIKAVHLEGLRVMGDPQFFARKYYEEGADELIYMDTVASLYGRNNLSDIVSSTVKNVFIPLTVGGGIRSVDDVKQILRAGADKVAINTAAIQSPELIKNVAKRFGSQCMVLSIEAKRCGENKWEALTDNARERTGVDVLEWVKRGCELGAGEILLTSVDMEGTAKGFDLQLVEAIASIAPIPVIVSGGMGTMDHFEQVVQSGGTDAIAMAHVLHYNKLSLCEIREEAKNRNIKVRNFVQCQ